MYEVYKRRIEALQGLLTAYSDVLFCIVYKDGHKIKKSPGDCIDLILEEPDQIAHIDGRTDRRNGHMTELLNDLLRNGAEQDDTQALDR